MPHPERLTSWLGFTLVATALSGCGPGDTELALRAERDRLKQQLQAKQAEVEQRRSKLSQVTEESASLRGRVDAQSNDLQRLGAELEETKLLLTTATQALDTNKAEVAKLAESLNAEMAGAAELRTKAEQLQQALAASQTSHREMTASRDRLAKETTRLSARAQEQEQAVTAFRVKLTRLMQDLEAANEGSAELKEALAAETSRGDVLQAQADRLRLQLQEATRSYEEATARAEGLAADNRSLTARTAALESTAADARERAQVAEQERDLVKDAAGALQQTNADQSAELDQLKQRVAELKAAAAARIAELERQLDAVTAADPSGSQQAPQQQP
jgi:chromosome segregation ATPase